jgi:hypothetical protein
MDSNSTSYFTPRRSGEEERTFSERPELLLATLLCPASLHDDHSNLRISGARQMAPLPSEEQLERL